MGITLCKKVRSNTNINHILSFCLQPKEGMKNKRKASKPELDSYIVKPFSIEVLRSTITNLIETRRLLKNKFSGAQEQNDKMQEVKVPSSDEMLMSRIMKIINDNLAEPSLSVEMLAISIGLSRVHLYRKLKETYQSFYTRFHSQHPYAAGSQIAEREENCLSRMLPML